MKTLLILLMLLCSESVSIQAYNDTPPPPVIEVIPPSPETVKVHLEIKKDSVIYLPENYTDTVYVKSVVSNSPWYQNPIMYISFVSLLLAFLAYKFSKKNKSYDFLFDYNKKLIDDPSLWAIYDNINKADFLNPFEDSTKLDLKIDALGYYLLNNFELVFSNTSIWSNSRIGWARYMSEIFRRSQLFRFLLYKNIEPKIRDKIMFGCDITKFEKIIEEDHIQLYSSYYMSQLTTILSFAKENKKFNRFFYITSEIYNYFMHKFIFDLVKLILLAMLLSAIYICIVYFLSI